MHEPTDDKKISDQKMLDAYEGFGEGTLSDYEEEAWAKAKKEFKALGRLRSDTRVTLLRSLVRHGWQEGTGWDASA